MPGDLGILLDVVAASGDAAQGVVKAVFGEIDQILAAMADGVDAFGRRADDDIDFAAEQRVHLRRGAMTDGHFLQALDAGGVEFGDHELHQRVADAAVVDRADFLTGQFFSAVDAGAPD